MARRLNSILYLDYRGNTTNIHDSLRFDSIGLIEIVVYPELRNVGLQRFMYCQVKRPQFVESADEYIQTPPIPTRYHQLRRLALLRFEPQSPRC